MTVRALALVGVTGFALVTAALAAAHATHSGAERTSAAPMHWVPGWLMEPLSQAIADATDSRDRKAK